MIKLIHHVDKRGIFYELWKGEPRLVIKQVNVSVNKKGVVRGVHAEPWDKYIHVMRGKVMAVIVDMKTKEYETHVLDNTNALLVPKGKGNCFQALEDDTIFCYLTTGRWQPGKKYPSLPVSSLDIEWPVKPIIVSEKDA